MISRLTGALQMDSQLCHVTHAIEKLNYIKNHLFTSVFLQKQYKIIC